MKLVSRRWFLKASALAVGALAEGRQRMVQGVSRLLSSTPPITHGYEEGVAGQAVPSGSAGVTATSGHPTYSVEAVKHGNLGVDVPARRLGATLTYGLPSINAGSGSVYVRTVTRGPKATQLLAFSNGGTVVAKLLLLSTGGVGIAGSTGGPVVRTGRKAALSAWTRIDWQTTSDGTSLAFSVRYYPTDAESSIDYGQISTTFATTPGFDAVTVGSRAATWELYLDTLRLYDNADSWPAPFVPAPAVVSVAFALPGNPTPAGATVSTQVTGVSTVDLALSTSADMSSPTYVGPTTLDSDSIAKLVATGLSADSLYYARLATAPDAFVGDPMRFRTLPSAEPGTAFTRKIAFGSCQSNASGDVYGSNTDYPLQLAWVDQAAWAPDEIIHVGDFGYWGGTLQPDPTTGVVPDYTKHIAAYVNQMAKLPTMRQAMALANGVHQRDDHEISGNNGESYENPVCTQSILAMQKVFASPNLVDSLDPPRGRYFSYNYGPQIKVIVVDGESLDRSLTNLGDDGMNPDATFFGAAQLEWIKSLLLGPECLKIIVAGKSLLGDSPSSLRLNDLDKTWAYAAERDALMRFATDSLTLKGKQINCEWWGADRHALGYVSAATNQANQLVRVSSIMSSGLSMHGLPSVPGEDKYDWTYGFDLSNQWMMQWMKITLEDDGLGHIKRTAQARQTDCSDLTAPLGSSWAIGNGAVAVDMWTYA